MQYNNRSSVLNLPPVTLHLIIINVILWVATFACLKFNIDLTQWLGLHFWQSSRFNAAQFVTYMFMHDPSNVYHVFCNMFSLFMFGGLIERTLGSKRYLFYYVTCGLVAALVQEVVWQISLHDVITAVKGGIEYVAIPSRSGMSQMLAGDFFNMFVTVGASGAVFGILLAFGMLYPNMSMYIIPFPFPLKAKWVVLGYGVLELFFGISQAMDSVAHFAHLGGMIGGILLILYWRHNGTLTRNGLY